MDDKAVIQTTIVDTHILHINLNRPVQLNALNMLVLEKLAAILDEAKHDAMIKGILLTGEGKAFCAGADIKQLVNINGTDAITFAKYGQSVFNKLELLGKPSIALIQGFAFGGGCELAMAATLRIAAHDAMFAQPEIKLGIIPGFGGTQRLARLIGKGRAMEVCLTGRRLPAEEAFQWGLVNELVMSASLFERGKALLSEILQLAPIALKSIMAVIDHGYNLSLQEALEFEAVYFGMCCTTADKREGILAFLEKRPAAFSGE